MNQKQDNWDKYFDVVMFSMWTECQSSTKYLPFEVMYGRKLVFPSEVKEPTDDEIKVG